MTTCATLCMCGMEMEPSGSGMICPHCDSPCESQSEQEKERPAELDMNLNINQRLNMECKKCATILKVDKEG